MPYTANKKPSGLDAASSVGNDTVVIEQSGSVLKATVDQVTARVFSAKGVAASSSGSEVIVVRDGSTLKDLTLSNVVPALNITDAKVASNAAIAGTKISPNFGSQAVSTTGSTTTGTLSCTSNATVGGTLNVTGVLTASGGINATVTGTSAQANQLATARNIAATQDIAWNVNFNGSANVTAAATISNNVVTDAKLRTGGACSVVGRSANSTGNVADISSGSDDQVLRRASGALGFGTIATGGIADNAVSNTKLRDSAGLSVVGNGTNASTDPADIVAASDGAVLRRSGTSLGFGEVAAAGLASNSVITAKIQDRAVTSAKLSGVALIEAKTANYTFVLEDRGKIIEFNSASALTATVPTNASVAFDNGAVIVVSRRGAGDVTIAPASGVTLRSGDSKLKISKQYAAAALIKLDANEWMVVGSLKA
jgi:hypothetical protein